MPRLIHAVPKYQKHRASGQAVVSINGRDHYLGLHGSKASRIEYDRLITEWLSSGRSRAFGTPDPELTIVELLADYLKYAASYYGTGSEYAQIIRAVRPLKELYGRTAAEHFGVLQFKAVREKAATSGRSRKYVNDIMGRVVRVFNWAAAEGFLPASIPQNLAIVPGLRRGKCDLLDHPPILPVDDAVVDATLPHLSDVVADMVRLHRSTGMRPAEVCMLRPCDVDRSGEVWIYRPASHKTERYGKDRVVLIGPKGQEVLLRYLARAVDEYCFRPRDSEAKRRAAQHAARNTPMSCGNRPGANRTQKPLRTAGDRYVTSSYRRAIHRGCDRAFPMLGLQDAIVSKLPKEQLELLRSWQSEHRWAPNQLRHAAATEVRREFGLVVDEEGVVVVGHTRLKAAEKLGYGEVPVHVAVGLSPQQIRAYRIADNQTSNIADWDYDLLPVEIAELQAANFDVSLLGFSADELLEILGDEAVDGLTDPDAVPEPPDAATTQPGDLWTLGQHRLLCGDSSSPEDLDRLVNGATMQLANCDPPYGV
jgi:integrase